MQSWEFIVPKGTREYRPSDSRGNVHMYMNKGGYVPTVDMSWENRLNTCSITMFVLFAKKAKPQWTIPLATNADSRLIRRRSCGANIFRRVVLRVSRTLR
jgi:hypothetical protein